MNTRICASRKRLKIIALCLLWLWLVCPALALSKSADDGLVLSQPLTVLWQYHSDRMTDLTPASDDKAAFVPLGAGLLLAIDSSDGKLFRRAETGGEFSALLVDDDRCVYDATRFVEL